MKDVLDYRVIILNKDNNLKFYDMEFGKGHVECLQDFATKNGYQYFSIDYLVNKGNIIMYNHGNAIATFHLPGNLDEDKLYYLDYLQNYLQNVKYMEVRKYGKNKSEDFVLQDNVKEEFSSKIIQSYYIDNKKHLSKKG